MSYFKWSHTWGMEFNVKKCKVLRVASVKSAVDRPDYFLRKTVNHKKCK